MNESQIKTGRLFLEITKQEGQISSDTYLEWLLDQGCNKLEIKVTIEILLDMKLISSIGHFYYLTPEGRKALTMGLDKYIEEIDAASKLDLKSKRSGIFTNKANIVWWVIGLIPISVSVLMNINTYLNKPSNNADYKRGHRDNKIQNSSTNNYQLNATLIDSISKKLSHDTIFINSVAKQLKAAAHKKDNNELKKSPAK